MLILILLFSLPKPASLPVCAVLSCSVVSDSLWLHGIKPVSLLCSRRLSRQEYSSGLPCPPPGDLPNPGTEPMSHSLLLGSLLSEPPGKPSPIYLVSYGSITLYLFAVVGKFRFVCFLSSFVFHIWLVTKYCLSQLMLSSSSTCILSLPFALDGPTSLF